MSAGGPYHVIAYKPHDPSAVRVKVSLSKENVYVMEGDRCLMSAAISVGMASKPTPKGNFNIYSKQEHKRSGSYGFSVQGDRIVPSTGAGAAGTLVTRWVTGASSRLRMVFIRALSILCLIRTAASG